MTGAAAQALDASGHYYGSRVAGPAFVNAATAIAFGPFAFVDESTPVSEAKVSTSYQQIATVIGPTTLTGASYTLAKAATFGPRLLTLHTDGISNVAKSTIDAFLIGNGDGDLSTTTAPTGCTTQIGGNTFTGYVESPKDPSVEAFRVAEGLGDEGIYLWCPGVVELSQDASGLHARKLVSGVITTVALTACNTASDSIPACMGKLVSVTHTLALTTKDAKGGTHDMPNLDNVASTDANVTSGAWGWTADVNVVKRNAASDMTTIWNRIRDGGAGQAAFLADLITRGGSNP